MLVRCFTLELPTKPCFIPAAYKWNQNVMNNKPHQYSGVDLTEKQIAANKSYFGKFNNDPRMDREYSWAFTKTVKDYGYDSVKITDKNFRSEVGGNQWVVFDPKNVVIID